MKRSILNTVLAASLVITATGFVADAEYLIGGKDMSHGGFGAMESKLTRVDGHTRVLSGGKAAYIMDHKLYMGFGGYGMSMGYDVGIPDSVGNPQYVQMGYGGLLFGYTFHSDKLVHLGVEVLAGAGGYVLTDNKYGGDHCEECDEDAWENEIDEKANVFAVVLKSFRRRNMASLPWTSPESQVVSP